MEIGKKLLLKDQSGAAMLEFSATALVLLTVLFGVVEFSFAYFQYNAATKAVQVGARLAAVSSPVWDELDLIKGDEQNFAPGTRLNTNDPGMANSFGYSVTCTRPNPPQNGDCEFNNNSNNTGINNLSTTIDTAALDTLVFGRGSNSCSDAATTQGPGMCDIFRSIGVENVRITYEHSNLGYATRPGGMVPTIRLELTGINFNFIFLDELLGLQSYAIPGLITTLSAEDLCTSAPTENPKWIDNC